MPVSSTDLRLEFGGSVDGSHGTYISMVRGGIKIKRGARKNPPLDQLEIGTMEFRIIGNFSRFSRGTACKLSALVNGTWEPVFTGQVQEARLWRDPNAQYDSDDHIDYLIVDRVAELATTPAPLIKSGNVRQRINSVLAQKVGTPALTANITGPISEADDPAPINIIQADARMLDQLLTIRNSDLGLLWVDRSNVIQYASANKFQTVPVSPAGRPTITFVDKNPAAGQKVVLVSGFDHNDINEMHVDNITYERIGIAASTGEPYSFTVGPIIPSVKYDGRVGHVPVIEHGMNWNGYNGQGQPAGIVNKYAGMWYGHWRAYDKFRWNATNDLATIAKMDIYDSVRIEMSREANDTSVYKDYRVLGLEHDIRPGSWVSTVEIRPLETFAYSTDSAVTTSHDQTPTGEYITIPT